jgi:hypothetical protein
MSLLDSASLILTPNAYKEGKLYSVIPSDGSGDFTFTRATTATRVNSAGLVELVPYNLFQYSEEFDNASWAKTASSVTANSTNSPSGIVDADTFTADGTSAQHQIRQLGTVTSGLTYTTSIYAKKNTNNFIQIYNTNTFFGSNVWANFDLNLGVVGSVGTATTASIQNVGNGWYRCTITGTATASGSVSISFFNLITSATSARGENNTLSTSVFLWGAQFVEGTNALPYQKTETRLNIPRIDYSLGGCPNILLEPQRTNLTTYSEQFDDASWNKINSSVTANADISPDGYTNADRIYDNATSGQHRVGKNISVVSATTYTFSVFAKKGSLRYCYLFTVAGGASDRYYFDLQDGVSITAGGKIEDYGSGWYRISAQVTAAATGNELFAFNLTNSSSSPTYSGTGTGYHMIYGYQVEAGDYATSYIPTTTASVTRNADVCVKTGISSLIGQTEGTIYLEADIQKHNESEFYIAISNGQSLGEAIYLQQPSSGALNIRFRASGLAPTIDVSSANWNIGFNKIAIAYNSTSGEVFINGASKGTVALTALPTCSQLTLGSRLDALGSLVGSGGYKAAALWKERLTNDQLAQLTTI